MFWRPTIGFGLLYCPGDHEAARRRLVWISVTANPTAEWIARPDTEAFRGIRARTAGGIGMLHTAMP